MLDEIVFVEVAEMEGCLVARRGGFKGLVALQPKEELRVFTEIETRMHPLKESIYGDVSAVTGKVAVVRKTVQ